MPAHKRYCNSLSTIAKDEISHNEDGFTLNNFDISNAVSPMKTEEEISRISFMQNLQMRVFELEQAVEAKNSIIDQQKLTIIELKNKTSKKVIEVAVQVQESEIAINSSRREKQRI